jgi:hypothetical protein
MKRPAAWLALLSAMAILLTAGTARAQESPRPATSCIGCHGDASLFEPEETRVVADFVNDVHASVGLSCHDCHGGNPDPALVEDYGGAKDESFVARGKPTPAETPAFCGSCHSDASFMRRYSPSARVDQESEFWSSRHGEALRAGDDNVATCTSCHGVHGILQASDPGSSVYPTQVADTCSTCHADADRMDGYETASGMPLPIDQEARWRESVHAGAMFDREDLTAPTCNDCHGNHGAAPPGLDSINFVCGQCHGREAEMFRSSAKAALFVEHNDYLDGAGEEGCAMCHEAPEPQAALTTPPPFGECSVCHGNHGVVRPSVALLSPLPDTPCVFCHEGGGSPVVEAHDAPGVASHYEEQRQYLLAEAAQLELEGEALFDWLVDRSRTLPVHTTIGGSEDAEAVVMRPEFARLFDKFRIGKTSFEFADPETGFPVRAPIIRCETCHASAELLGDDAVGLNMAAEMLARMRELTTRTAQAERLLLSARRGGVETRTALEEIDQAVDARVSLDALLHTFDVDGDFYARYLEGIDHADAALRAGQEALDELQWRRRGLALALLVIVLVLIGLALKIRDLEQIRHAGAGPADRA